jgi:predicted dehydrogenase
MTIRVAAIEVNHWHALHDAAYLRHLIAMPDVELVAIQDSDAGLVARRATEVGSPPTFTDYRHMLATTRPDFVVALGRHRQMAGIAHDPRPYRGCRSPSGALPKRSPQPGAHARAGSVGRQ